MNLDQTGQHYLIDKAFAQFIVDHGELTADDIVLEIGYGQGALTKLLEKKCAVIAIDIADNRWKSNRVTFYTGNILEEFDVLSKKHHCNKIISNIPYAISEPLLRKLFKSDFDLAILLIGKNFAELLAGGNNRIGILAQSFYDIEILRTVPKKSFHPQPRVDSAIVRIEPKPLDMLSQKAVIYKKLVLLDEKKLINAFEKIFVHKTKKEIAALCKKEFYTKKLFQLTNEEFVELDADLERFV